MSCTERLYSFVESSKLRAILIVYCHILGGHVTWVPEIQFH